MKYSIGEFASILGVTVDTLRLYEKHGILKPFKDKTTKYRYFDDLDARNLLMSRWLRSLQFSLHEVAELTKNSSVESIVKGLTGKELALEEEIRKKTLLLNRIKEIKDNFESIESDFNRCKLKKLPGIYRLKQTNGNTLLKEENVADSVSDWMSLLPHAFYSFRIDGDIISEEEHLWYSWGLAMYEDDIKNFDLQLNDNVEYIPPKTYISSVIFPSGEEYITRTSIGFILDFMKENNYAIAGDIFGKLLFVERGSDMDTCYLEINIPII